MGKIKLNIDKTELSYVINEVEGNGPLSNRGVLAQAVANTDWARNFDPKPVTQSIVISRIEEFGIVPKTPKGKRGVFTGSTVLRKSSVCVGLKELFADTPEKYHSVIRKIEKGSKVAAIKLKCLECSNWHPTEVKKCPVIACALHSSRPYK